MKVVDIDLTSTSTSNSDEGEGKTKIEKKSVKLVTHSGSDSAVLSMGGGVGIATQGLGFDPSKVRTIIKIAVWNAMLCHNYLVQCITVLY